VTPPAGRYGVAAGLVVLAVALGAVYGVVVARALSGYDIEPVAGPAASTVLTVGDRPQAVWVSPATADTSCSAREVGTGRDSYSRGRASLTITQGDAVWERVGIVSGRPGSTHELSCTSDRDVTVGQADNPRLTRYVVLGVTAGVVAVLLVVAGGTLALVTALRRRAAARP
jgi:hypothetical protein